MGPPNRAHCGLRIVDGGLEEPGNYGWWMANGGVNSTNPKSAIRHPQSPCCRGQSLVEYMVIVGVVVLAIMFFKSSMHDAVKEVYNQATNHASGASAQLRGMSW